MEKTLHPESLETTNQEASLLARVQSAYERAKENLARERCGGGHWTGELSTSALSTATAISAMAALKNQYCVPDHLSQQVDEAITDGAGWLEAHQNPDGGFGDTDRSHSNIATSFLAVAAWKLSAEHHQIKDSQVAAAWNYIQQNDSWDGLRRRYGKDKTFVVPILSNCAIAGIVGWDQVQPLPFEAAWLPQDYYRLARLPVVSYAIPALVAIGQSRFRMVPPKNGMLRTLRNKAVKPTLQVLERMQPSSGGYLEAVPLTSFVLMNLAVVGNGSTKVAQNCLKFILDSRLEDGSWPIDTNLATWVTTLSLNSLSRANSDTLILKSNDVSNNTDTKLDLDSIEPRVLRWVLSCQHRGKHPFTGARPGGWGWTDLSGAVPDADDTPSALLAISKFKLDDPSSPLLDYQWKDAVNKGLSWLLKLQNRNGGWPTFCRGWGKLPFDRSGTDLTAHAIRALACWMPRLGELNDSAGGTPSTQSFSRAIRRGFRYLKKMQAEDGSWDPLWFGNQDRGEEDNPIYGTGRVLLAYAELGMLGSSQCQQGLNYLRQNQNSSGGWGGGPSLDYSTLKIRKRADSTENAPQMGSIEETAIALEALIQCGGEPAHDATIMRGLEWLCSAIEQEFDSYAWPIGFYFAKLWYYEKLYPTIFSVGALGSALRKLQMTQADNAG